MPALHALGLSLPRLPRHDKLVHPVSAAEEQEANERYLRQPVTEPRIRFRTYRTPAVVLGCSQRGLLDTMPQAGSPPRIVRAAGGGAVLVGPAMLSASILLPAEHPLARQGTIESYRWLGECFAEVLQDYGIDARALTPAQTRLAQADPRRAALGWACYGGLSPWEVVVGGRKIVGLAQVRRRTGVLLVAGLLLDRSDWTMLCTAMNRPEEEADLLAQCNTSCQEELGRPMPVEKLVARLQLAMDNAIHPHCTGWPSLLLPWM